MKKLLTSALAVFLAVTIGSHVSAAGLRIEAVDTSGKFIISGTGEKDAETIIQVFVSSDQAGNQNPLSAFDSSDVAFHDQMTAGPAGEYRFELSVAGPSKDYEVFVYSGGRLADQKAFNFSNNDEFKQEILAITQTAQQEGKQEAQIIEEISATLSEKKKAFGLSFDIYEGLNADEQSDMAAMLYREELKTGKLSAMLDTALEHAKLAVRKYAAIAALNGGSMENIFLYQDDLQFQSGEIAQWYDRPVVTENIQRGITERISKKHCTSIDMFDDMFLEAFILEIITDPNGYGTVEELLEHFSDFIGIDSSEGTQAVYQSLVGEHFSAIEELKRAFESAVKETTSQTNKPANRPSGGSGGGSGGGGSVVSIGTNIATIPVVDPISQEDLTEQPVQFDDCADVPWADEAIKELAQRKIISGRDESHFAPMDPITREEFAKIIIELFSMTGTSGAIPFRDVSSDDWFYPYVAAAYANKVISGISEDTFGSGQPISRQDICVMIYNAATSSGLELEKICAQQSFADSNQIGAYAAEAVAVMQTAGVVNGFENDQFKPLASATRAQAAVMLYRLLPAVTAMNPEA